jgi:hypothetical protein
LRYILHHPVNFRGTSYYPVVPLPDHDAERRINAVNAAVASSYNTHHANFDFNFLPVDDAYPPLSPTDDSREAPSLHRNSAMFDWFERIFNYKQLAHQDHKGHRSKNHRGPLWMLFSEADVQSPENPTSIVISLGVDGRLAPLTLTYLENVTIGASDVTDERWITRVWHAWTMLQAIQKSIYSKHLENSRLDLWAFSYLNVVVDDTSLPPLSSNGNFVRLARQDFLGA